MTGQDKYNRAKISLVFGLTSLLIILLSGCVSSGKFEGMTKERNTALEQKVDGSVSEVKQVVEIKFADQDGKVKGLMEGGASPTSKRRIAPGSNAIAASLPPQAPHIKQIAAAATAAPEPPPT